MKKVLGIFRAACYSPGMGERDKAILRAVATRLEATGHAVSLVHEEDFAPDTPIPDIVLHMARSARTLRILQGWERTGCRVINPTESVRGVERSLLPWLCAMYDIPAPKTRIVTTSEPHPEDVTYPCWIKRTGTCAQEPGDVCRVNSGEEYTRHIGRFHTRGIDRAVVMQHIEGPCIKFYAVRGTGFFHCLPAYDKWSGDITSLTSGQKGCARHATVIKRDIIRKIEKVDTFPVIYGGDAIISDGIAHLIDLNDWPSFSACREEAADAIARLVVGESENSVHR